MSQKTLDSFFGNNTSSSSKHEIKRYFYLQWLEKNKPVSQATWESKQPEKINFIHQVKCDYIKKGFFFYICGFFFEPIVDIPIKRSDIYKNVPFLKSHLQKNIRKKNEVLAIQTCSHLFQLDIKELLRRLPIIMLEDTYLHESFSTLVWIMVACSTNKFKMTQYIYEWILGTVYVIAKLDKKDNKDKKDKKDNVELLPNDIPLILEKYEALSQSELSLLYSIRVRCAYGGMDSDIKMLEQFSVSWYDRFIIGKKTFSTILIRPISIAVADLKISDWDISAIDYHCFPTIIDSISKKYPDIKEADIRKMIWHYSSSINARRPNSKHEDLLNLDKWPDIKEYVFRAQRYLLNLHA